MVALRVDGDIEADRNCRDGKTTHLRVGTTTSVSVTGVLGHFQSADDGIGSRRRDDLTHKNGVFRLYRVT